MNTKLLASNKKARHEYFIEQEYEAGIALKGTEVKSLRKGKVSIKESFCQIRNGEVYIYGMHISPYEQGNIHNVDPTRTRKLLLHRREINRLIGATKEKGFTLIPLSIYLKDGLVKIQLGLAKGKKIHDKRETIAKRDSQRRIEQALRRK